MKDMKQDSILKQIKALIAVLGAGAGAGLLIAIWMLYHYNPSGSYLAKNLLLEPTQAYMLRFTEPGMKARSEEKYLFDKIVFSYLDPLTKKMDSILISEEQYRLFYELIGNDTSFLQEDHPIQASQTNDVFNQKGAATLTLKVRSLGNDFSGGKKEIFSQIEIESEGNEYRIPLRQSGKDTEWIYFHHPGIYQKTVKIFKNHT